MPGSLTRPLVVLPVLAALLCLGAEAAPPISLVPVMSGLTMPVYVTSARDGTDRLFVVEQAGAIKVVGPGQTSPRTFLDITSKVLSGGERGLLGLAFHPQIEPGRRFYVSYTRQPDGAVVIAEYRVSAQNANVADTTEKEVLVIPHPFENHNGGMLEFGPDDFLYISLGDGGDAFDPDNRAQDINHLLGKILRIDVDTPNGTQPYSSPSTNPFVGRDGANEIWVYGLRNPWRFSFDRETGALYVGDVGQDGTEEIDILTGGDNAGWRVFEASQCTNLDGCDSNGYVFPITEYSHNGGRCSVTGGYVYRGRRASLPFGSYVYGDYCSGEIFVLENGANSVALDTTFSISSFGEDEAGEILVVDRRGGAVYRIAAVGPAAPPQLTLAYDGKARDRVGAGNTALSGDGAMDATLTMTVSGVAGRALTGLRLQSSAPGTWDTSSGTGYWVLGMARGPDDTLLNQAGTMAISLVPGDGDSFTLFASDAQNRYFGAGRTLTVTATFSGGATATARTTVPSAVTGPPPQQPPPQVTFDFIGMQRDRVGAGNTALSPDGAMDGTFVMSVSGAAGRALTALRLQSSAPGMWDTSSGTGYWVLGITRGPDDSLLNQAGTMALSVTPADGELFHLFAADYQDKEFLVGRTLTLTATFTGGVTVTATIVP